MQVKHYKTLVQGQLGVARTQSMCWSPNNKRLAVADANRFVQLFDELGDRRDKFPTKSADGKGGKNYVVTGLAFSPDSAKIAVAQSDSIISIYRVGVEWGDKKFISNKFPQTSPVTCVCWPNSSDGMELIVFGTMEGKVKAGLLKSNKSQSLYGHEHAAVSICANKDGNKVVVGHVDGAVFVYVFSTEDGNEATGSKKLFQHSCPPYVLSWGEHICAAGQDCIVTFYNPRSGNKLQSFDFPIKDDVDLTAGGFNPSGQTLVVAAHEKLRFFDFNLRSRRWEEGAVVKMPNSIGMANTAWKHDGSRLITGGLTGAVDMFDACLKRYRLRGAFEFTYVSHNQVIVKRLATGTRIVLRSNQGFEIQRVNVHHDRYLVAHTSTTLLVGDLLSCKLSEIPWQLTGREKFVFDNPQVCMVFTAGELCLIEYDKNMLLGTCRTEERSAHRISVRLRDPNAATTTNSNNNANPDGSSNNIHASVNAVAAQGEPTRVIAYLLDRQTIQVDDLISGVSIARIAHDHKIDWLELDYRARRLLFRDKQHQLFLYDMHQQKRTTLLNYCTFVQWVPGSDVVVAQNRVELCVWYSINNPDRVTVLPIKGEVEGIERSSGKTEVIIEEGVNAVAYALDEPLIEFGVAMEDRDFIKACDLLAQIVPMTPETEALWEKLSQVALADNKLDVAERCFAALGDVAKVEALHRIAQLASSRATENYNAYDHYTVQAELLMLTKEFKLAEQLLLENGDAAAAMKMWDEMNRFDESIAIAESRKLPDLETRRARYFQWLMETQQLEKAGAMKEKEGKHIDAINLYLRGGTPAKAAAVVSANGLKPEQQLLEAIAAALFRAQIYEQAGNFFEKLHMDDRAIDAYKSGHVFSRAVEFAKREHPDRVSGLEEEWGDYLVSQMHVDQAINHYSAAGKYAKAVEAAINSRQWSKAADLLETQNLGADNDAKVQSFYKSIARHYEEIHQYPDAEKYFIKAGAINDAVEMYSRAGMADHMYRVAQRHLNQQQLVSLFMNQARQLEAKGDHAGAERIFLKVNEPDQAIVMYKRARDFTNMIRLVQAHRPDYLLKTHLSLAAQFEKENNLKTAETHYVAGKDWGRAVNMYRDRDLWDDAVRVAKVHGGANAAKQVVLSRAMAIDSEDGLRLLAKFSYVEAGIESALEAQKFDLALQWAQGAQPAKVPYVYLKYAMHYEDQGDFRMAEDAFLKSGKPREAIDMYVHQHEFTNAMRVAENYDQSSMPSICAAHGRVCFQQGNYKEAEGLFMRANAPEALLKMYVEARMYSDAQRVAKEHCPEMMGDVAKRIALQSNDPQKAGAVLEENGEYQLAIETYLGATSETVNDATALTNMWVRAVKVAQKHVRNMLKEVLKESTTKLKEAKRFVEAGKCFEDCEEYKSAINMYVQGKKFDMAESLAKRISPELEDYVKRAIVQDSIEGGNLTDAKVVEEMDPEAAMQSYIANSDFDNAIRVAKGLSSEKAEYVAALEMQYHLRQNNVEKALEVVDKYPIDTKDFRFNETWMELAQKVIPLLPSDTIRLHTLHQRLVKVLESMTSAGESNDDLSRANALVHVIHIYHVSRIMTKELQLPELGLKLMLGLPRWIPRIAPDKAFYDAGMAAKDANAEAIAFVYLNRSLDIAERIEDGDNDSSGIDNHDFDATDFPKVYHLPQEAAVSKTKMEAVNSWVLTFSIDVDKHQVECKLPTVTVNTTEQMFEGSLKAPSGTTFPECAVSGYPILGGGVSRCTNCQRTACQEDWNRYVMISKCCPWCETSQNPNFAM